MYQDAFDALAKIGLKRDEARIYLACLRNKSGLFTHEITRLSGVKRSTVDLIVRRLLARNFLGSFRDGRRRKFVAEPPERILFAFQSGLDDFRGILPALMRLGADSEQTRVTFYEGAKGVRAIYDDVILTLKPLPEKERINYCVSSGRDVERIQPRFQKQFIDRRIRQRIAVRMIAVRNASGHTWPSSKKDLRVTKMFDGKKYPFSIELNVYDDKVFLISAHKPVGGIIIQNRVIAHSLRSFFNLIWDLLGPPEPDASEPSHDILKMSKTNCRGEQANLLPSRGRRKSVLAPR